MQIEVKDLGECKLNIQYEADPNQVLNKRKEVVNLFKDAPVKGFRPGSKPNIEVIKLTYRKEIDEALKRALAEEAFHNTLFEKEIKSFGSPEFKTMHLLGNKFNCEFNLYKRPDFALQEYKGMDLVKQDTGMNVNELAEKMLQDLRVRFGENVPFSENDFVQQSDDVIVNYKAFNGDEQLDNLTAEGELLTIGQTQLPGFDDNLLGMKAGETREFSLLFPDTALVSVAGKSIKFVVEVVMGSKNKPLALDDELAKKMNKNSFEELHQQIINVATSRLQEAQRNLNVKQVSARLIDMHEITVPNWLVLSEAQYLVSGAKLDWNTMIDADKEQYLKLAERNVKLSLILEKIREEEPEAQLSDQEILDMIHKTCEASGQNPDQALQQMNESGYLPVLVARMRDEHVLDLILKNAKIAE